MASQMVHKEDIAVILKPIARSIFFFKSGSKIQRWVKVANS